MMRDDEVWGQGISGGSWEGGPKLGMEFLGWGGKCLTGFLGDRQKALPRRTRRARGKPNRRGTHGEDAEGNHSLIATPRNRTERVCVSHRRVLFG